MRKLLFVPWNHPEVSELQPKELDIPEGGECFQVCWTPCFPAKWLAGSGRIKNVSQNHLQDQKTIFVQFSKCRFVKSQHSPFVTPLPSPHFHPCTPPGSLGCPLLLWLWPPLPLSHHQASLQHKTPQPAWLTKLKIKIKSVVIWNLSSPYYKRNWVQ